MNSFQCFKWDPVAAKTLIMDCVTLHNLMRICYPGLQNQVLDREGEDHVIHRAWRDEGVLADLASVTRPTQASREAKAQRVYLKYYYSTIGSVPWQRDMI